MKKFNDLINSDKPVLVDFYADWCAPCKVLSPMLEELAQKIKEKVSVIKVNIDKNMQAANTYRIQGVPTLILFKNGKILWRQSGVLPANQLEKIVAQYI